MEEERALQIIEQKSVTFYGDELTAARGGDEQIYVSIRQVCDALGLDAAGQRRRIRDHDILSEGVIRGTITTGGGPQQTSLIRVDYIPLWLSAIRVQSAREDVREKLRRFQREAARVLWEAFREGRLTTEPADILTGVSPETAQAVQLAQAVLALARNQALLESRLGGRFDALEQRLETVEAVLGNAERYVTQEQASMISQAVKAVALELGKKSVRNEHGAVYGELYRKFGITGYKMLPARRFEEAMSWLTSWHQELTGQRELPF